MSEGTDPTQSKPARVPASRYVAFLAVAIAGVTADLVSKEIVFSWPGKLTGEIAYWWWEGHAGIQTSLNEGALFGIGYGKVWLFAGVSLLAAVAIPVWLFVGRAAHCWWITLALGGVMGGVLGNLYDRLGLSGEVWLAPDPRADQTVYAVRDWILWQVNDQWRWPNFNIADALLVVSAGMLFVRVLFEPSEPDAKSEAEKLTGL